MLGFVGHKHIVEGLYVRLRKLARNFASNMSKPVGVCGHGHFLHFSRPKRRLTFLPPSFDSQTEGGPLPTDRPYGQRQVGRGSVDTPPFDTLFLNTFTRKQPYFQISSERGWVTFISCFLGQFY